MFLLRSCLKGEAMPFELNPKKDCLNCKYGKCVSYIREQSKRMKDRDTQYRLAQKSSMACTYDKGIPGLSAMFSGSIPLNEYVNRCISNGVLAGQYIEADEPEHFGEVETSFSLTSGQIGKVRGDIFETLVRAILWNSCSYMNKNNNYSAPNVFNKFDSEDIYGAITLGDNYDLKKLFTPASAKIFRDFENQLEKNGTSFCYSTPDVIVFKCKDKAMGDFFSQEIHNLSISNQDLLATSRSQIEGKLNPEDIVLAAGIKTSIRSDRMYQLLFEANAWKAIWRVIYGVEPSKYYSLIGQSYGADPKKLNSIEFTSLNGKITKAIDGLIHISTPDALINWFVNAFDA
jgi:hypothetical protein